MKNEKLRYFTDSSWAVDNIRFLRLPIISAARFMRIGISYGDYNVYNWFDYCSTERLTYDLHFIIYPWSNSRSTIDSIYHLLPSKKKRLG